jgi:predicted NBD/HSP70 family sugar kinase
MEKTNPVPLRPKADKESVRSHNLGLVLQAILHEGEATRAEVASRVGLTRAAISSLVDELIESGYLTEHGKTFSGQVGRPGTVLRMSRTGPAGLGLGINVNYITAIVVDLSGAERVQLTEYTDNRGSPPADILGRAAHLAARALVSAEKQELHAVGVELALPSLIFGGMVCQAPNSGWSQGSAEALFAQALAKAHPGSRSRLSVTAENEVNLAALAELWFGGLGLSRSFLYVSGEIGSGGALVVDGKLFRGTRGFAGEIGHVAVRPDGPQCRCGANGCLEQYAGQAALLRTAGLDEKRGQGGIEELARRAAAGDRTTVETLEQAGEMLGLVLSGAVNLLDPDTVVLGGIYRGLAEWLARGARRELARRIVSGLWADDCVRTASLAGPADAARGAAAQAVWSSLPGAAHSLWPVVRTRAFQTARSR